MNKTVQTTDTHSLTPNSLNLEEGQKIKMADKEYTCTRATQYQAFFAGQDFVVPGASNASPVTVELEVLS